MKKNLDDFERNEILIGLKNFKTFNQIANELNRNRSTISREVFRNRKVIFNKKSLSFPSEKEVLLNNYCELTKKAPYVCNSCPNFNSNTCTKHYIVYEPQTASRLNKNRKKENKKLKCKENIINDIQDLLNKNQTIPHIENIIKNKYSEDHITGQTIYNYIEKGILIKLDKRKKRKYLNKVIKEKVEYKYKKDYLKGREYLDFKEHIDLNPHHNIVEMDLICGPIGNSGYILTLFIPSIQFLLAYKLKSKYPQEVIGVLNNIEKKIGTNKFKKIFNIILTDRGSEFLKRELLEKSINSGTKRCKVFYCDKASPSQKSHIENSHRLIRRFVPKGVSLEDVTQDEIYDIVNNINSLYKVRYKKSPNEMFIKQYSVTVFNKLSLKAVHPELVKLTRIR